MSGRTSRAGERGPVDAQPTPASPQGEGALEEPQRASEPRFFCDLCGHAMLNLHCKLICERCGYKRDCSDP